MPPIRSLSELDPNKTYTYADYLSWQLTEWVELIRGRVRQMAGASTAHQLILVELIVQIGSFLRHKPCVLLTAPHDVRLTTTGLNGTERVETVVQPDIYVNCDPARMAARSCIGPPEWVIEIVSPSNASRDVREKFAIYEEAGVGEYWIVYPSFISIYVRDPQTGHYQVVGDFSGPGPIPCHTLPELVITWESVFPPSRQ
ncbi:MAG: Uma2 family endonuclease [Hymenobacteraceae bacterium]|nr:Uma2 family endonuclease [Hymenobacteraceae bacterium]